MNLNRVLSFVRGGDRRLQSNLADTDRLAEYSRYLRAYQGFRTPNALSGQRTTTQLLLAGQRLRYNFNRPIVNLGAAFMTSGALKWKIDPQGDGQGAQDAANETTAAAFDIWDRSGSDRAMLRAARTCGIYGDVVALATADLEGRPRIEFVSPDICFPTFSGNDSSRLEELDITWEEEDRLGRRVVHREFYDATGREVFLNGEPVSDESQTWDTIPAVWIRNLEVQGLPFGLSDLDGVVELAEAYDHVMTKREKIIDYYSAPTIVFKGIRRADLDKTDLTTFFVPADGDVHFLEWTGTAPDVEQQLDRIRNDLAEISQVPAVAFGRQDSGLSSISGVALKILYGPLVAKTGAKRASWGPGLEYVMWLCLRAEGRQVPLEAVNVQWPDPLPQNLKELVEEQKTATDAGILSRRTAAANLGVEDPDAEQEQVRAEQRMKLLKDGVDAGLSLRAAAEQAGAPEAEMKNLLRRDTVDGLAQ